MARNFCITHGRGPAVFALAVVVTGGVPATAQNRPLIERPAGAYVIGANDLLSVTVADLPEESGKFRVSDRGTLVLPGSIPPIEASGLEPAEVAANIATALKNADLLRNPTVNVWVEEYRSRTVSVLGALEKPSVYSLTKPTTVLEVLAMAGGLTPTAGNTVTISHADEHGVTSSAQPGAQPGDTGPRRIDIAKLLSGRDTRLNVEIHPGDVVSVSSAPIVYVVGAVNKPGGFPVHDSGSGVTVLEALALAEGVKPIAAANRSVIVRRTESSAERKQLPIDVVKLMEGKTEDLRLQSNDILFIPESGTKKNLRKAGEIAVQAASGIAIYGVGYRIGR